MKLEYTKLKIQIDELEIEMTVEQAKKLQKLLNSNFGSIDYPSVHKDTIIFPNERCNNIRWTNEREGYFKYHD